MGIAFIRLLNEASKKVVIKRDVTLNASVQDSTVILEAATSEPVRTNETEVHSCPKQQIRPPIRYGIDEYADTVSHATNICDTIEPSTMQEALLSDNAVYWKQAADLEYEYLLCNKAWELVELPVSHTTIGCKLVLG